MTSAPGGPTPLRLELLGGPARVGAPVPVGVTVVNSGNRAVVVPGVLDGSESGLRSPVYRPQVCRGDIVVAAPEPPEDPLVAPLRPEQVVRLAPGEGFDPTGPGFLPLSTFATFVPTQPGRYRFVLTLDTRDREPSSWLGRSAADPGVAAVLTGVPAVLVTAECDVDVG